MRALLASICVAILFASACAITCYDCDSIHDPRCNEYFEPEGVQQSDCEDVEMPDYLLKYRRRLPATGCLTKIHDGVDGLPFFIRRSCYFGNVENTREACEAVDPFLPYADIIRCDVCDEDLCNTGEAERSAPLTVLPLLLCTFVSVGAALRIM